MNVLGRRNRESRSNGRYQNRSREGFALTPTEPRAATSIARGLRTDEIALDLGITGTTFAFHLRKVFRKAGVNRQQELVALLSRNAVLSVLDER
ncbi:DNA-binding CsgD family transcriptional regulator [Devosia sp. UYZn731]|uniref:helix-turn-helix transcriptional regulator n=1 Tax=Devosia sp. UYZn731 TaxID=3156345 RepID=UPI003390D3F0